MAELEKHCDREDWLRWAIEFMRRGVQGRIVRSQAQKTETGHVRLQDLACGGNDLHFAVADSNPKDWLLGAHGNILRINVFAVRGPSRSGQPCPFRDLCPTLGLRIEQQQLFSVVRQSGHVAPVRGKRRITATLGPDAMALVGQHGVYCQSQRWPGKPVMDVQLIMKTLTDAKELIQSVMEELKTQS